VVELETGSEVAGIAWGQQTSDIHIDRQTDYSSHTPQLSSARFSPRPKIQERSVGGTQWQLRLEIRNENPRQMTLSLVVETHQKWQRISYV